MKNIVLCFIKCIEFSVVFLKRIFICLLLVSPSVLLANNYLIPENKYETLKSNGANITLFVELNNVVFAKTFSENSSSINVLGTSFGGQYKAEKTFDVVQTSVRGFASKSLNQSSEYEFEKFYKLTFLTSNHSYEEYVQEFNDLLNNDNVNSVFSDTLAPEPHANGSPHHSIVNIEDDEGYHLYYLLKEPPVGNTEGGINAKYAWDKGYTGQGIKVIDIEYRNANHTNNDLPALFYNSNCSSSHSLCQQFDGSHGTGVAGIIAAKRNNFHTVGIAYGAKLGFQTDLFETSPGRNPAAAILSAATRLNAGDIILMEEQTDGAGLVSGNPAVCAAAKSAIARGVVVVETAGNNSNNLDLYPRCNAPIIVVAADQQWSSSRWIAGQQRGYAINYTNYGSPVVAHALGRNVVTTGVNNRIRYDFNGTSGAAPIVTGAIALIQSAAKDILSRPLSAQEVKDLIQQTGLRYRGSKPIGHWVDVKAAIEELDRRYGGDRGMQFIRYKNYLIPISK